MTQQQEDTVIRTVLEIINENGLEGIGDAVSILINEAPIGDSFIEGSPGPVWYRFPAVSLG